MQDDVIPHAEAGDEQIAPVPRISLQAFCETAELASVIADAAEDRRMDKAHVRVQMGGAPGAVAEGQIRGDGTRGQARLRVPALGERDAERS